MLIGFLSACATPKPYQFPANMPAAKIKSQIYNSGERHNSAIITLVDDGTCKSSEEGLLFQIGKTTIPNGFIQLPANKPILIKYLETASAGRTCTISGVLLLEEGEEYVFQGGTTFSGKILIDRGCELKVKNLSNNSAVPIFKSSLMPKCK